MAGKKNRKVENQFSIDFFFFQSKLWIFLFKLQNLVVPSFLLRKSYEKTAIKICSWNFASRNGAEFDFSICQFLKIFLS